jgi:hypothetical protein
MSTEISIEAVSVVSSMVTSGDRETPVWGGLGVTQIFTVCAAEQGLTKRKMKMMLESGLVFSQGNMALK